MEIKQIEIRDRCTFIPSLAIRVSGEDGYLFRRAGFGSDYCIILTRLVDGTSHWDPYNWKLIDGRTMHVAHLHLVRFWEEVKDQEVLDIEFILGETRVAKTSERLENLS